MSGANDLYHEADNFFGQGKYDKAIEACDEAIRLDPYDSRTWKLKGISLYHQGKYDGAIKAFDEALGIDPKNAKIWYCRGCVLVTQEEHRAALKCFDRARDLTTDPEMEMACQYEIECTRRSMQQD